MVEVKFDTTKDVTMFINICNKYKSDIDLYKGRYIVDAKSVIGVLGMSFGEDLKVEIHTEDENESNQFYYDIKEFVI